jgi:hypothetical protein
MLLLFLYVRHYRNKFLSVGPELEAGTPEYILLL